MDLLSSDLWPPSQRDDPAMRNGTSDLWSVHEDAEIESLIFLPKKFATRYWKSIDIRTLRYIDDRNLICIWLGLNVFDFFNPGLPNLHSLIYPFCVFTRMHIYMLDSSNHAYIGQVRTTPVKQDRDSQQSINVLWMNNKGRNGGTDKIGLVILTTEQQRPGGRFNIKMSSYKYRDPHIKDTMVSRHGNPHTWEIWSLYRYGPWSCSGFLFPQW